MLLIPAQNTPPISLLCVRNKYSPNSDVTGRYMVHTHTHIWIGIHTHMDRDTHIWIGIHTHTYMDRDVRCFFWSQVELDLHARFNIFYLYELGQVVYFYKP